MLVETVPPPAVEDEFNPLLSAQARFDEAANRLGIDEGLQKVLRTPSREMIVHIPVQLDDGRLEDALAAQRKLAELGVHVRFKRPKGKPRGPVHAA